MSENLFPRTTVEGVSLPRMLIGTNWFVGCSHKSAAIDKLIVDTTKKPHVICDIVSTFVERGVDAILGGFVGSTELNEGIKMAEDRTGKKLIKIDTPFFGVEDSSSGRKEAREAIKKSRQAGATFCLPHHSVVEQLVNKHKQTIDRLPDYLEMIRDEGMIPGVSAHMPELLVYSDKNEYDVQTYIQLYNCLGYLMQIEVEFVHKRIQNARKPVMTIKPMAAGRVTPFIGLNFVWNTIRECDMVTVGTMTKEEAAELVEISLAAIERRAPDIEGRSSPNKTSIMA